MEEEKDTIAIQDIPEAKIFIKENNVYINEKEYVIVENYKNALESKSLEDRYTALLQKYHYIVGDWGHEQLRLKGFYENDTKNVADDQKIGTLQDYLREYCAFGCAYFVLHLNGNPEPFHDKGEKTPRRRTKRQNDKPSSKKETQTVEKNTSHKSVKKTKTPSVQKSRHEFVIRKGKGE
ncbi:DUF1027 domain-containing protein [Carnobacteriaceae bacterium zg-ZUI252]|nr:DUF1027 domain-containing protein [Carnobacteriaceae bacterium zg-ZUI252]